MIFRRKENELEKYLMSVQKGSFYIGKTLYCFLFFGFPFGQNIRIDLDPNFKKTFLGELLGWY